MLSILLVQGDPCVTDIYEVPPIGQISSHILLMILPWIVKFLAGSNSCLFKKAFHLGRKNLVFVTYIGYTLLKIFDEAIAKRAGETHMISEVSFIPLPLAVREDSPRPVPQSTDSTVPLFLDRRMWAAVSGIASFALWNCQVSLLTTPLHQYLVSIASSYLPTAVALGVNLATLCMIEVAVVVAGLALSHWCVQKSLELLPPRVTQPHPVELGRISSREALYLGSMLASCLFGGIISGTIVAIVRGLSILVAARGEIRSSHPIGMVDRSSRLGWLFESLLLAHYRQRQDLLLEVQGDLNLRDCVALTSLSAMKIGGNLNLTGCTALKSLPEGMQIGGNLFLSNCFDLTSLPAGMQIGGNLFLSNCFDLTSLPEGMRIGGDLCLINCTALKSLPEGMQIGGHLNLRGCSALTSLPEGMQIGGHLDLSGCTALKSLPKWILSLDRTSASQVRKICLPDCIDIPKTGEFDSKNIQFYC